LRSQYDGNHPASKPLVKKIKEDEALFCDGYLIQRGRRLRENQ